MNLTSLAVRRAPLLAVAVVLVGSASMPADPAAPAPAAEQQWSAAAASSAHGEHPIRSRLDRVRIGSINRPAAGVRRSTPSAEGLPEAQPDDRASSTTPPTADLPGSSVLRLTRENPQGFSSVGVTWTGSAPVGQVAVQVRTRAEGGDWTTWADLPLLDTTVQAANAVDGERQRVNGTDPMWVGRAVAVDLAITTGSAISGLGEIEAILIDPQPASGARPTLPPVAPEPAPSAEPVSPSPTPSPDVTPRPTPTPSMTDPQQPSVTPAPRPSTTPEATTPAAPAMAPVSMQTARTAATALAPPPHYSRAQWGADESLSPNAATYNTDIQATIVHHTADANGYAAADVPAILRSIHTYHVQALGWADIGYNVLVDAYGRIWEGRKGGLDQPVRGAHAIGFNTKTFGISMMGNFSTTGVPDATREAVAQMIAWKFKLHGVDPRGTTNLTQLTNDPSAHWTENQSVTLPTIIGHRDVNSTSCPGTNGYAQIPWLRERVAQLIPTLPAPPTFNPRAAMQLTADPDGVITAAGWAVDESFVLAPTVVTFMLDGVPVTSVTADAPYPVLANYGIPGDHGFTARVAASDGLHDVCAVAHDVGAGTDVLFACGQVKVEINPIDPVGAVTVASAGENYTVTGWAYDGSSPSRPVTVEILRDGAVVASVTADQTAPAPTPPVTGRRGFSTSVPAGTVGAHTVCARAKNLGGGKDVNLGCATRTATAFNPIGALRGITQDASGTAIVHGWAWDQSQPLTGVNVAITANDQLIGLLAASGPYVDNLAAYGIPGNHGFDLRFTPSAGTVTICAYAFNVGLGANSLLGCQTSTMRAPGSPIGGIEPVRPWAGHWIVSGWAWDPSAPIDPVTLMLTVDGKVTAFSPAASTRPELAGYGIPGNHGIWYATTSAIKAGQSVCVYAFNIGVGENQLLDCKIAR